MERESNPMQALCRSGCGFYGSPATDGLCSLCYKEALKKKQQPPVSAPSPASSVNNAQSLTSLMETTTAQPTVPCLPSSVSVSSTPTSSESSNVDSNQTGSEAPAGGRGSTPGDLDTVEEDPEPSTAANDGGGGVAADALDVRRDEDVEQPQAHGSKRQHEDDDDNEEEGSGKRDAKFATQNTIEEAAAANTSLETGANNSDNGDKDGDKDAKKKKNRCATCRKKVGLTGFECRCGGLFCAVHRYSDKHDCSFNYREMGAQEIRRNNPVVVGEKIQKI